MMTVLLACSNKKLAQADCVGIAREDCICIQLYAPVCGCDDETYTNSCYAKCAGVKTYTEGKCK